MKNKFGIIMLSIAIVISIAFIILYIFADNLIFTQDKNYQSYIIAINNLRSAEVELSLSSLNDDEGIRQAFYPDGYEYSSVNNFYNYATTQALKCKELAQKSKTQLEQLSFDSDLMKQDIALRISEADILISLGQQYASISDYHSKELYEINYGDESKATMYWQFSTDLVTPINVNIEKLGNSQNKIDLLWAQDWYEEAYSNEGLLIKNI